MDEDDENDDDGGEEREGEALTRCLSKERGTGEGNLEVKVISG